MNKINFVVIGLLLLNLSQAVSSMEVAGVQFEPDIIIENGQRLQLNGAGVRKKFLFSIYVAALYLPEKNMDANQIISQEAPSRVVMHVIYSKISKDKVAAGWNEGFQANHQSAEMANLNQRLERFNQFFEDLKEGDRILFDYIPGEGTKVTVNRRVKGVIPGADFKRALLKVWLGESPVTKSLKSALLRGD